MRLVDIHTRYVLAAHNADHWAIPAPLFQMQFEQRIHPNGQHQNEQSVTQEPTTNRRKMAAVLVLLAEGPTGTEILLTRRAATLRHHAHQISFPGGRVDDGELPADAALRETWEEVGIAPAQVNLWGPLPWQQSQTGYLVQPWLGQLRTPLDTVIPNHVASHPISEQPLTTDSAQRARPLGEPSRCTPQTWPRLQLNSSEVSHAFAIPVNYLHEDAHWQQWLRPISDTNTFPRHLQQRLTDPSRQHQSARSRVLYFLPYQQQLIWGLTAAILHSLRRLCLP
jgi:mutator protein MutT